ncbi:MAG: MFS transporter [Rhodospirillaceae bacterium]|nr:MFS transporter [Rhodospirillaceae bacterium]
MAAPPEPSPPLSPLARLPFYYGWVVLGVAFATMAIGANVRVAFSLLFPPILEEYGWSRGTTAAVFSAGFLISLFFSPFAGVLIDRYGVGRIVAVGAILSASGLALSTGVGSVAELAATMGCMTIGGSVMFAYVTHSYFLPYWFVRRRGMAIGLAFTGVGIGAILLFPWLQGIIGADGWRRACYALALRMVGLVRPLRLLLPRRRPREIGLGPAGDTRPGRAPRKPAADAVVDPDWAHREWTFRTAARTGRFWWLHLSYMAGMYAWYAVLVHQTKFLIDIGVSAETAAFALGLVGLTGVASQIGIGMLSDRIGREWGWSIAYTGFTACYVIMLILPHFPALWLVYVMVVMQGLIGYGASAVYPTVPAELFHSPKYGQIFGIYGATSGFGAAVGPWATGELYDLTGGYETGFAVGAAAGLLSIGAMWMAAPRKVRLVAGQAKKRAGRLKVQAAVAE